MSITVGQNQKDEIFYEINSNDLVGNESVHYIFPPLHIYNHGGQILEEYRPRPDDRIVNKDIAILKYDNYRDTTQTSKGFNGVNTYTDGDFAFTNSAGAFYAIQADDYFNHHTGNDTTITVPTLDRGSANPKIAEAIQLPKSSTGGTFANRSMKMKTSNVNRFDDIEVTGLDEGEKPEGQQMVAIRLGEDSIEDVTYRLFDTATISSNVDVNITSANTIYTQIRAQAGRSAWAGIANGLVNEADNTFINATAAENSAYVSGVEIVNIERDLDDLRYGDDEDEMPFQFTGAMHVFTDTELDTTGGSGVEGGSAVPISVNVYGGDSFIGLHTFKVSDSTYVLTDPDKEADNSGTPGTIINQVDKWGHYFDKLSNDAGLEGEDMSRPYPLRGASQTLTVLLESEINPNVVERSAHTGFTDALPVPRAEQPGQIRSKFDYRFNLDYARQNDTKIWLPFNTFEKVNTSFNSRVIYSDPKIYKSDIEGFDTFKVLNFYDLDETFGDISKLQLGSDSVYAFQEKGIQYIPILAESVELAEGGTLAVRSGEIIGTPIVVSSKYGTQHPKTVKSDGKVVFFADQLNKVVGVVSGRDVEFISRNNMRTHFRTHLNSVTLDLYGIYDTRRNEYWLINREESATIFNLDSGTRQYIWWSIYCRSTV
ncbi:hypothetical protein LCGC14_0667800 [marine sediment metagenome]|uniref:Crassvirus muzzle protein N-terminal region domain-containing protein n=1 Tax=marine sediment metagenome TaxID=412755 RepID=A0A0F9TD94_9ZZZZ